MNATATATASTSIPILSKETTRVANPRRSIFIEIRERGTDSVVARSRISHDRTQQRISRRRGYYSNINFNLSGISILDEVTAGDFVEIYIASDKSKTISVKKTKMTNVATPYVFDVASAAKPQDEIVLITPSHAVFTTLERRQMFARDVYELAQQLHDPIYKLSALRSTEQLFLALVSAKRIPLAEAERMYSKYEKISARIWRGQTEHEQVASFNLAFAQLSRATGLRDGN